MRLHGLQNGVAHRHRGCLLATSGATLPTGRWCSPGLESSPPPLGRVRFSAESRQNALGDFELIELVAQLCPFGIEPREPLGNPQLLLPNLVQRCHLPSPSSFLQYRHNTTVPVFSENDELRLVLAPIRRESLRYVYAGGGRSRKSQVRHCSPGRRDR